MGGSDQPNRRKAAKRKEKEKANNTVVELVTSHFKEFSTTNNEISQMFKDLVTIVGEKAIAAKDVVT